MMIFLSILRETFDSMISIENIMEIMNFMFYFIAGLIGTFIREFGYSNKNSDDDNKKPKRHSAIGNVAMSLLSAVILFMFSKELVELIPRRGVFGVSVLFSIIMPVLFNNIKNGESLKLILRNFLQTTSTFLRILNTSTDDSTKKVDDSKSEK